VSGNDPFDGVFNRLNPEDFAQKFETTAAYETSEEVGSFDAYVDSNIGAVRISFQAAPDGWVQPVCALSSATQKKVFIPDDGEVYRTYIDRLNREARLMGANRVFIFLRTKAAVMDQDTEMAKVSPMDKTFRHLVSDWKEAVYWYAEDRTLDVHRHGFLPIKDERLGEMVHGMDEQPNLFQRILGE